MWSKILAFLENKVTRIVTWCVLAIAIAILIIGGVTKADLNAGIELILGIISAIAAFIAFLISKCN